MKIERLVRDNVVNGENDFDSPFTFSVFGVTEHDSHKLNFRPDADWLWSSNDQYVAICSHMGGDYRCNYSTPRYFRCGDCIADTGFVDWMVGWHCESGPDQGVVDRINEECTPGYHQSPTSALEDMIGTDEVEWQNGSARTESGYVLYPTYYGGDVMGEVLDIPPTGYSLYDVSIDRDAWIEAVLNAGDAEEITNTVESFCDVIVGSVPEWDDSEDLNKVFETIYLIDECYGDGASKAIAEELESNYTNQDGDVLPEVVELHEMLIKFIDATSDNGFVSESDEVYEFMTNAGV